MALPIIRTAIKPGLHLSWRNWLCVFIMAAFLGLCTLGIFRLPSKWIPYFFLALLFPFVLLVSGVPKRILLGLILLDIPLQLDISLKYSWILESTGSINGYIVSITTICLVVLYLFWLLEYLAKKPPVVPSIKYPDLYLTRYIFVAGISMAAAELQMVASFEIFLILQIYLLVFYVINNIDSRQDLLFILVMLFVGLILESLVIMLVWVSGKGFSIPGIIANVYASAAPSGGAARIGGTLVSANTAGSYVSLLLAPAVSILLARTHPLIKWLSAFAAGFGAIALVLTGSRGAWLAAFLSFLIFCFVSVRKGWVNKKVIFAIGLVGVLIALVLSPIILERIFGDDAAAAEARIPQYLVAWRIIKAHPVFGVGANNYFFVLQRYLTADPNNVVFRWVVHNKYLLVWAETGIFGLLFFILFLVSTIRTGFKVVHTYDDLLSPLALGFASAIVGQMVHMFFDVFHSRPQVQLLWLVAGLLIVMYAMPKNQNET